MNTYVFAAWEQSAVAEDISSRLQGISTAAMGAVQEVSESTRTGESLQGEAETLRDIVGWFHV
ncbi:MAG: hypothetical protein PVF40_08820 [Ectothiorhodospiraceae bacterium]|jgi:methyl-accepting chemotaxis protein